MKRTRIFAFGALIAATMTSQALTINLVDDGGTPGSGTGGGTLASIFLAAKQVWEAAYADPHTLTIGYTWASLGSGNLGSHSLVTQGGSPNRETEGYIRISNTTSWFMDSTPYDNSEYTTYTETSADYGGGTLNNGRVFTGATGDAAGRWDMFSVVMHEIGHALGLSGGNTAFIAGNGDLDVDVTAPRAFAGSSLPTVSGAHLNIGSALMFPSLGAGIRRCPSTADVLANAEISQFTQINYNPCAAVPEPGTMIALGAGALAFLRKRRKV